METKHFASLYLGVSIAERMILNDGNSFLNGLYNFPGP